MDPITKAVDNYIAYLKGGGQPVSVPASTPGRSGGGKRKLHPSGIGPGLCDRRSCYQVMADTGEIKRDIEESPEFSRDMFIGYIFQDFIAAAIKHHDALVAYEFEVESEDEVGRVDMIVDPLKLPGYDGPKVYWVPDVKTVKGYGLYDRYPKTYNIAQVEQYLEMLPKQWNRPLVGVLYYMTRILWESLLVTWEFSEVGDCETSSGQWLSGLAQEIAYSKGLQLQWLHGGALPDRVADQPWDHWICARYDKSAKLHHVECPFWSRCWERALPRGLLFGKEDTFVPEFGWEEEKKDDGVPGEIDLQFSW